MGDLQEETMKALAAIVITILTVVLVPAAAAQSDFVGTQWQLVSYGPSGAETPVVADSNITLTFESENQITGNGGCNGYSGSYTAANGTITFSQVISTMMACLENGITEQEQAYFEALQTAESFELVDDQLTIRYNGGQLNFVRLNALDDTSADVNSQIVEPFEDLNSPVGLLASYYNAINRQEYQRAYAYWESPPNSYDDFVNGFADTASVQVIVEPPRRYGGAAGSLYVDIPTVLIALHTDGTQLTYAGCFVTRRSNLQPPDIPEPDVWHLYSADITAVPNDSAIPTLLSQACTG